MTKQNTMSGRIASSMRAAKVIAVLIAGFALTACESVTCALGINNDAKVTFTNISGGNISGGAALYVAFDGSNVTGNIPDGGTSGAHSTSSGVHTVSFRIAGGTTQACSTSFPDLKACATTNFSCLG